MNKLRSEFHDYKMVGAKIDTNLNEARRLNKEDAEKAKKKEDAKRSSSKDGLVFKPQT
jgi:hypothetical protein